MRHGLVASLFILALVSSVSGREPLAKKPDDASSSAADYDAAAKMAQESMEHLKSDGITGFIDVAFSGKPGSLKKEDRAKGEASFRRLHDTAVTRFGKPLGEIERVRMDVIGQSLVRFVYVERLERIAILWQLSFYRGESGDWRWIGFNMTDRLDNDFRLVKETKPYKDAATQAENAIEQLRAGGIGKLFDVVFAPKKTIILADRTLSEAGFVKIRENTIAQMGKSLTEFELIRTESVGPSVVRFVYLEKCEGGAVIWKLSLYRSAQGWKWRDLNVGGYQDEFSIKQ